MKFCCIALRNSPFWSGNLNRTLKIIEINWDTLFAWPGYDFWGIVLSLVGFAASIFFAASANSKAGAATIAAESARNSMTVADTSSQLRLVQQILIEVRLRVESSQWEQVSDRCEAIRIIIAPLISSNTVEFSKEIQKSLVALQSQMASLQKTADEVRHKDGEFDMVKIGSILTKQAESVAMAVRELKDNVEVNANV